MSTNHGIVALPAQNVSEKVEDVQQRDESTGAYQDDKLQDLVIWKLLGAIASREGNAGEVEFTSFPVTRAAPRPMVAG